MQNNQKQNDQKQNDQKQNVKYRNSIKYKKLNRYSNDYQLQIFGIFDKYFNIITSIKTYPDEKDSGAMRLAKSMFIMYYTDEWIDQILEFGVNDPYLDDIIMVEIVSLKNGEHLESVITAQINSITSINGSLDDVYKFSSAMCFSDGGKTLCFHLGKINKYIEAYNAIPVEVDEWFEKKAKTIIKYRHSDDALSNNNASGDNDDMDLLENFFKNYDKSWLLYSNIIKHPSIGKYRIEARFEGVNICLNRKLMKYAIEDYPKYRKLCEKLEYLYDIKIDGGSSNIMMTLDVPYKFDDYSTYMPMIAIAIVFVCCALGYIGIDRKPYAEYCLFIMSSILFISTGFIADYFNPRIVKKINQYC